MLFFAASKRGHAIRSAVPIDPPRELDRATCSVVASFAKLCVVAALTSLALGVQAQDDARRKAEFNNRLGSVKALSKALTSDPVASRPEARAALANVEARQKEAEELAKVGEYDAARMILDEGYGLLTRTLAALKTAGGSPAPTGAAATAAPGTASRQAAYERSLASARSLLDAARRSSANAGGARAADLARIESSIGDAENAGKAGDFGRGDSLANGALNELRPLLISLKGGSSSTAPTPTAADADPSRRLDAFDGKLRTARAMADALKRQNQDTRAGKDATIEDIEARLRQAEAQRGTDIAAAGQLLDDAYDKTRLTLQSINTPAAPSLPAADSVAASGATGAEIDRMLKSSALLRDAVVRVSKDKGTDNSSTLSRIDALSTEARSRQASDPARALQAATEANQTAKDALAKLR